MPIHLKQRLLKSLSGQWLYMVRIAGQQLEIMNLFSILWRLEFFELRLGYQINAGVRNMEVGSIFDKIVQTRLRGDWNAWSVVRRSPKSWKLRGNKKKTGSIRENTTEDALNRKNWLVCILVWCHLTQASRPPRCITEGKRTRLWEVRGLQFSYYLLSLFFRN